MGRRRMYGAKKEPMLVKLLDLPGSNLTHYCPKGYKYVDMLIMGGGGSGGYNSGGGGASGTILYVKDFILSNLSNKQINYRLGNKGDTSNLRYTSVTIDGNKFDVSEGYGGGSNGFNGSYGGDGGGGGSLNGAQIVSVLTKYVSDVDTCIAIANNGGGAGGYWNNSESYGYAGGTGASMSGNGIDGRLTSGLQGVYNRDGTGGNKGGGEGKTSRAYGRGCRWNSIVIPIESVFDNGGGYSGSATGGYGSNGAGGGGGGAGYGKGGSSVVGARGEDGGIGSGGGGGHGGQRGGYGGQGGIILYYHN